ncbi:MAG: hypothetical protein ACOY3O_02560 [Thermodesulfobacteriota bacterium]
MSKYGRTTTMESYIITIYRYGDELFSDRLVGTFADPCAGSEQRFATLAELHRLVDEAGRPRGIRNSARSGDRGPATINEG